MEADLKLEEIELASESCNLWNRLPLRMVDVYHPRCRLRDRLLFVSVRATSEVSRETGF